MWSYLPPQVCSFRHRLPIWLQIAILCVPRLGKNLMLEFQYAWSLVFISIFLTFWGCFGPIRYLRHNGNANGEFVPDRMFAAQQVVCAISASDRGCVAGPFVYWGLLLRPQGSVVDSSHHFWSTLVFSLGVKLKNEGNLDFSDILPSCRIGVHSGLRRTSHSFKSSVASIRSPSHIMRLMFLCWCWTPSASSVGYCPPHTD